MDHITHAFLHIPTFRELIPISRDPGGRWTIDDVPHETAAALGRERFGIWKREVFRFIEAGILFGSPDGLQFEMLAAPDTRMERLNLLSFADRVLDILQSHPDRGAQSVDAIHAAAANLGLCHTDTEGNFRKGPRP